VLPNNLAGTEQIVHFLANEISTNTYLNIMDQYRPAYKALNYPELNRSISSEEFQAAVQFARDAGLNRLDQRRSIVWRLF
jgi:putative pyruvate formate lyase activating enzyme